MTNHGHNENTKQISIWVNLNVLERWNDFCEQEGINRSSLIKTAVNEYIRKNATERVDFKLEQTILDKFSELESHLEEKITPVVEDVDDPTQRDRILKLLELQPMDTDELVHLLGMDKMSVALVLKELKADRMVTISREGKWNAN